MRGCIVIIAEEDELEGDVAELLRKAGYEIKGVPFGPEAYTAAYKFMPEMVLYKWPADSPDAKELFTDLRNVIDVPILVLMNSSTGGQEFTVELLRLGADDCLAKPYSKKELLARIKAHLRRYWQWSETESQEEPVIDPVSRSVTFGERNVKLSRNEYRLLRCLIEHDGGVVTREELRDAIWGTDADCITPTNLNLCIHKLRKKIERDPHKPKYIMTRWGIGYYLGRKVRGL